MSISANHKQRISLKKTTKHLFTAPDQTPFPEIQKGPIHYKHIFNNLFKEYDKVLNQIKVDHDHITIETIETIFSEMYYLFANRSSDSQQLLESIADILNSPSHGPTLTNLFKFILLIENVEYSEKWFSENVLISIFDNDQRNKPIGVFNSEGDWYLEEHQKLGIRKLYQQLYYNRLARNRVQTYESERDDDYSYSPQILTKSRMLAEKQRTKIRSFSKRNLLASKSHEELLIVSKKMREFKIKENAEKLEQEQKKKCPFQPKVNQRRKSVDEPKDRCIYLYHKSKLPTQSIFQTSIEQRENKSFQECTFHPTNISGKINISNTPQVKNSKSSIERMKQGNHSRQMSKTFKERGYPKNMSNWTKFFQLQKRKMQYDPNKSGTYDYSSFKEPILTVKVQLGGTEQSLEIHHGQSLESLACKILVKNNLPSAYLSVVEKSLKQSIESSGLKIKVENGFLVQLA